MDATIFVWDMRSCTIVQEWLTHRGIVHCLSFSPARQRLVSCARSPDGALMASASVDGTVLVWDAVTFQQRDLLDNPHAMSSPGSLRFSPDAHCFARISHGHPRTNGDSCTIWTPLIGEQPRRLLSHPDRRPGRINALLFYPESRRIATAHGSLETGRLEDSVVCMYLGRRDWRRARYPGTRSASAKRRLIFSRW
ncbi:WD40-repeat-containing domain protein [Ganoderma leucocontextum]|nr:WD40-repeat-containing domain protein [Ganoderma leucocontextum]